MHADLVNMRAESFVTDRLTIFMDDSVPGTQQDIEERSSDTTTGKDTVIGEGLAACALKE